MKTTHSFRIPTHWRPEQLQKGTESSCYPEPEQCVDMSQTISSWYRSTSCTSSISFPAKEFTFHIPSTSLHYQGSAQPVSCRSLPPGIAMHLTPMSFSVGGGRSGRLLYVISLGCVPPGPHGPRHNYLTLRKILSQAQLQEGVPVSLLQARFSSIIIRVYCTELRFV